MPAKRQRVKSPKICRAPETGRAADSMRTDKLITPESPALREVPSTHFPHVARLRQHPERRWLLPADKDCRGIPDETRGPEGLSEHPPRRCISTSLCFSPRGRLLSPLLPPGSYNKHVCMSKLRAASVGIVICYEQQQLDSVSNNSYINKRLPNKYWL